MVALSFFPIGVNGRYAPIEISALSDANTVISARVYGDPPPFLDSLPAGINDIADSLYWELGQEPGGEDVEVKLYWDDASRAGIDGMDSIVVLGLDGATDNWENYGNEEQTGKNLPGSSGSVSSRRGDPPPFLTDRFTIGGISGVGSASLPAEMTTFRLDRQVNQVQVEWLTVSEQSVSHFVVERSGDGRTFEPIRQLASKGSGAEVRYYFTHDQTPFNGINYYRIKIVDLDGTSEYSPIESVLFERSTDFLIAPNPSSGDLQLIATNFYDDQSILEVFDQSGRRLYRGLLELDNGYAQLQASDLQIRIPGNYFLKITSASGSHTLKFMMID